MRSEPRAGSASTVAAVALLSYAVLTLEIACSRIYSVVFDYHATFAVVSTAVLGLGLGGLVRARWDTPATSAARSAMTLAVSTLLAMATISRLPDLGWGSLVLCIALSLVPFTAAGTALAGLFQQRAASGAWLYGADLGGAALATAFVVPALDAWGAPTTLALAAAISGLTALLLRLSEPGPVVVPGVTFTVVAGTFALMVGLRLQVTVPIAADAGKEMNLLLSDPTLGARVVESRWGAFGRTDMVESALAPNQRMLFVDGAAGAVMYRLGSAWRDGRAPGMALPHGVYLPLRLLPQERKQHALVIGAGGGRDVALALWAGVAKVTAVEVNPDLVAMVKDHASWNGGIFAGDPGVTVVVAEGRSFLKGTHERYDVIMLALPVTKSSRSVDGYALTESYLFTVEAMADYLDHLNEAGTIVAVAHHEAEIYRLLALAARAFARRGMDERELMRHVYTVPAQPMPALVIERQPITPEAADAVRGALRGVGLDGEPFYVPCDASRGGCEGSNEPRLLAVAGGRATLSSLAAAAAYDLSPVDDDRPFFFDFEPGLPSPLGGFAIASVLVAACLGVGAFCCSLSRARRKGPQLYPSGRASILAKLTLIFGLVGAAYMVVEIALFQKLMLYVGQPQRALTVLLFSLLLGSAAGALSSRAIRRAPAKVAGGVSAGVAVAVVVLAFGLGKLFGLGLAPHLTAALTLVPLGGLMGVPFPVAIRLAHVHGLTGRVARLWGVNGVTSVLGAVTAVTVGHLGGFTWALATGAALYALVALLFWTSRPVANTVPSD